MKTFIDIEGIPKHFYKDIVRIHKKTQKRNIHDIVKSLDTNIDYKVPTFLKEFTYEGMVKDYFGLDLVVGDNAPRLSKQLSLKNIECTPKELEAFGQLKEFFNLLKEHKLFIDTEDMEIPFIMDNWSPNSCHRRDGAGNFTHFENKLLGFSMLKIYTQRYKMSGILIPYMRAYFYKKGDDIAHAGSYSRSLFSDGYPLYSITSLILCVLFGKRLEDFKQFSGLPSDFYNGEFGFSDSIRDQLPSLFEYEDMSFWNNMHSSTDYTKYTTNENIFDDLVYEDISAIAYAMEQDSDYYIVDYFNATITFEQDNLYMEEK